MSEAQTTQSDQQQPQEPIIQLALPLSIVNLALQGLAELPLKTSMAAVEMIQRQAQVNIARMRVAAEPGSAQPAARAKEGAETAAPAMKAARKRPARSSR